MNPVGMISEYYTDEPLHSLVRISPDDILISISESLDDLAGHPDITIVIDDGDEYVDEGTCLHRV